MKLLLVLTTLSTLLLMVTSFGGSEDKFLKKYAMMKIYESCFGPEVVKQIRKEMKIACAKCAALEVPLPEPPQTTPTRPPPPPPEPKPDQENQLYPGPQPQPGFDAEKLHQAILAYRPNPASPNFYRPGGFPAPSGAAFYNPAFSNPGYQQSPMFYPGFPQHMGQFSPYAFPLVGQSFYGNRASRDMDIKAQLEALTSRMSGRVRNVTCVMQELGYLDDNLEPNFQKITERIENLPVSEELKRDMQDGVSFCQQFAQCVPDVKKNKSPLSRELVKPMFFFKCYKHKKLEACIMKDVREKYSGVTDEDFDGDVELRRTSKASKLPPNIEEGEIEELASSMYEFLYGSDSNLDIDGVL